MTLDSRLKSALRDRSVDFPCQLYKIAGRGVAGRVLEAVVSGLLTRPELGSSAEAIKVDC
jgi:hypothetical protein